MSTSEPKVTQFAPGIRLVSHGKNQQVIVQDVDSGKQTSAATQQQNQAAVSEAAIMQRGYDKGFAAGEAAGVKKGTAIGRQQAEAEAAQKYAALQQQYQGIAGEVPAALQQYLEQLEIQMRRELCTLSIAVAETILRHELSRRDLITEVIDAALQPLLSYQDVKLHLCPTDAAKVRQAGLSSQIELVDDAGLSPGEAMVHSRHGFIDATLRGRLEAMADRLRERLLELETADAANAADDGSDIDAAEL